MKTYPAPENAEAARAARVREDEERRAIAQAERDLSTLRRQHEEIDRRVLRLEAAESIGDATAEDAAAARAEEAALAERIADKAREVERRREALRLLQRKTSDATAAARRTLQEEVSADHAAATARFARALREAGEALGDLDAAEQVMRNQSFDWPPEALRVHGGGLAVVTSAGNVAVRAAEYLARPAVAEALASHEATEA